MILTHLRCVQIDTSIASLQKDVIYYQKEVAENEATLEQMKQDETKDEYDIKQFQQVLDESCAMIPDSQTRLEQAREELRVFVQGLSPSDEARSTEWYPIAQEIIVQGTKEHVDKDEIPTTNVDDLAQDEAF